MAKKVAEKKGGGARQGWPRAESGGMSGGRSRTIFNEEKRAILPPR